MIERTAKIFIPVFVSAALMSVFLPRAAAFSPEDTNIMSDSYNIAGETVNVYISRQAEPTSHEGRMKEETGYYFLKFNYRDNFYSINLPDIFFEEINMRQREKLVREIIRIYDQAFDRFAGVFGFYPALFRFSVTFGSTKPGYPFHVSYSDRRTSNIFANFLPYGAGKEPFSQEERIILLHETGHGLFLIAVGNIEDPRGKYIEEGFADYIAGENYDEPGAAAPYYSMSVISAEQAENFKGLSQLDFDAGVWGEETVLKASAIRGYVGITHHVFGREFLSAFISVFGKEDLYGFLVRFKKTEDSIGRGDFGTNHVLSVFKSMGYTPAQIEKFRKELYSRLRENVFVVK
ncbi:MAG: hypothetical protein ABH883_05805 [Candidatus Omnitrophota bacterium]